MLIGQRKKRVVYYESAIFQCGCLCCKAKSEIVIWHSGTNSVCHAGSTAFATFVSKQKKQTGKTLAVHQLLYLEDKQLVIYKSGAALLQTTRTVHYSLCPKSVY